MDVKTSGATALKDLKTKVEGDGFGAIENCLDETAAQQLDKEFDDTRYPQRNLLSKSLDLGENRVGRSGPDERLWASVGILHILIDFGDQLFHATERPASNGLLGDAIEPEPCP